MTIHDGNATVIEDKPRWHNECSRCLFGSGYDTSTIHDGSRRGESWSSVAKPWMIRRTTIHNSWRIVRVRGVEDSMVSPQSSTIGYDLSRIAANIATVSVRISTIPLGLRYELGHAQ